MASAPEQVATTEAPVTPMYAPVGVRRTDTSGVRRWIVWIVVIAAIIGAASFQPWQWLGLNAAQAAPNKLFSVDPVNMTVTLTEDGELKPRKRIELKCEVEGQSAIRYIVDESTKVDQGDLLLELASDDLTNRLETEQIELEKLQTSYQAAISELELQVSQNDSDIKKAQMDLDLARLEQRRYIDGEFVGLKQDAELNIQQGEMDIKRRVDELKKNQKLRDREYVTQTKIDQLEFELDAARMKLDRYRTTLMILMEYDRPKMEKQLQSAVEQADEELTRVRQRAEQKEQQARDNVAQYKRLVEVRQARVDRLGEQLAKCKIFAPVDGVVQYPTDGWRGSDDQLAIGSQVRQGQTLLVLPDTSQMIVETRIHEADRHRVLEGMPVIVKVPAVPNETFYGTIAKIAKYADSANRWLNPDLKEHTTEILLKETDAPVSPGDSAEIEVLIAEVPNALAVPVQSVQSRNGKSFVFIEGAAGPTLTEVKLGHSTVNLVEILEGLEGGEQVHLDLTEKMLAMLPPESATGRDAEQQERRQRRIAEARAAGGDAAAQRPAGGAPGHGRGAPRGGKPEAPANAAATAAMAKPEGAGEEVAADAKPANPDASDETKAPAPQPDPASTASE